MRVHCADCDEIVDTSDDHECNAANSSYEAPAARRGSICPAAEIAFLRERACCVPDNRFGHTHACHKRQEADASLRHEVARLREQLAGMTKMALLRESEVARLREQLAEAHAQVGQLACDVRAVTADYISACAALAERDAALQILKKEKIRCR